VVREHKEAYVRAHHPPASVLRVLDHIASCRTAALGGHLDVCADECGFVRASYNSCRDRHCPKCQGLARAQWVARREQHLLPTPYFHVVFTIPAALNAVALRNQAVVYGILFAAGSQTLLELARDPEHLGAQIGVTAVLHTWGSNLALHPHLHCVVTGGGLSLDGQRWVPGSGEFFLPVRVMGALFRGKFLALLQRAYERGELDLTGTTAELADPMAWAQLRDTLYRMSWVVYAKPPFGGPDQVIAYLGRYTHRVAITNHRIVGRSNGSVTFVVKDYKDGGKKKILTLDGVEFLRRFVLHVLPKRFVRLRHYGLNASANLDTKLATAKRLLGVDTPPCPAADPRSPMPWWERLRLLTGVDVMRCPGCGGRLVRRHKLARAPPEVV